MDSMIDFIFRGKFYRCEILVDDTEFPPYIFVILSASELVSEFGNDLTLKTDFETLLPRKDDTAATLELRQTIFSALRNSERFQQARANWQNKLKATYQPNDNTAH